MNNDELKALSDADLLVWAKTASDDLAEAANYQRESEWHQSCFAAAVAFSLEMSRRGLRLSPVH